MSMSIVCACLYRVTELLNRKCQHYLCYETWAQGLCAECITLAAFDFMLSPIP